MSKSLGRTTERVGRGSLNNERVKVLTHRDATTVESGAPLSDGLAIMQLGGGDALLVCRDGRVLGMVTERDVLTKVLGRDGALSEPVDGFMTSEPETLTEDSTIREALELMDRAGYRHVPLVDTEGQIVGVLRQQDILEYVAEAFPQEILNLPPRPKQTFPKAEGG